MAYTKFASDIFLSYRHLDNQPLSGEKEGWISRLHRDIERRVSQYLGTAVAMWRDDRLGGNDYFSDVIEEQLLDVAVMVSVISPGYKTSDWCRRELRGFLTAADRKGGIRAGTKSRLFKVLKMPTERYEQPEVLQDLLGYEFFHEGREFHLDPDPSSEKRYLAKLDDLARDIQFLLREMVSRNTGTASVAQQEPGKTVYLAWTTSDVNDGRDSTRRELLDRGYQVLPETSPPLLADSLIKTVRQSLEKCCLSVHPIGARYGVVPEGERRSLAWLQHDLASERQKHGGFGQLLWMPPALEIKEPAQEEFLTHLEKEIGGVNTGFQLLRTPLEELKNILVKELREEPPRPPPEASTNAGRLRLYLICERSDVEAVQPIETFLRARGFVVDLPLLSGDPSEISNDHRETLVDCDAVLLYHGGGSEAWLREKIRDCRRVPAWGRTKPFLIRGIYIGPGPNQEYQNDEFLVYRNFAPSSPQALEPFVAAVSQAAKAGQ